MSLQELLNEADELAARLGLRRYQLYERLGVNKAQWSRWRRGIYSPQYASSEKLRAAIDDMRQEADDAERREAG